MSNLLDLRNRIEPQVKIIYKTVIRSQPWYVEMVKTLAAIVIVSMIVWGVSSADDTQSTTTTTTDDSSNIAVLATSTPDAAFLTPDVTTTQIVQTESDTDTGKLVTISAPNEDPSAPLVDVLASTTIPHIFKVGEESKIHIKWKNNGDQEVTFHAYDTDHDGYLDYVEWTVPHLSEQTFQIIFISKAFELDADQNIVSDIYDQTQTQDGNYVSIPDGNYIRATFNQVLDNTKDITIYAKPTDQGQSAQIAVYPVYTDNDGNQTEGSQLTLVSDGVNPDFSSIDHDGKYRVLLQNLQMPTDVFDLRMISGVSVDYIVDPTTYNLSINTATDAGCGVGPSWTASATCANINGNAVQTFLNAGTSVTLIASGDITNSAASISKTSGGNATTTFYADGSITISGPISSTVGKLNLLINADRNADSVGAIAINAALTSNGGDIIMGGGNGIISAGNGFAVGVANKGIYINNAAVNAGGGNIIANGQGVASGSSDIGVQIGGASGSLISTSTGTINITGKGGGTTSSNNLGVVITSGGIVSAQDGNITINASGGGTTGSNNYGIEILSTNSTIKTTGLGNISVTGNGGSPNSIGSTNSKNYGFYCAIVNCIQTFGTGSISVIGTGGSRSGTYNSDTGIQMTSSGASITSAGGDITLNGTGGNGQASGIMIDGNVSINNTGTGNINIISSGVGPYSGGGMLGVVSPLNNLTINTTCLLYLDNDTTVTGNLTLLSPNLFIYGNKLTVGGNWLNTGTFIDDTGGSVIFNGTNQTISGSTTFDNLTLQGSGTTTLAGPTGVGEGLTISPSAALDVSSNNYPLAVGGNFINNGIFNSRNGTTTFDDTTTISGSSTTAFNNLAVTGSLTAPDGSMSVAGNLNNSGTFNGNAVLNNSSTNSGTINGNATFNASSTNYLNTSFGTVTGNATFNSLVSANNTVSFSGTTSFGGTGHVTGSIFDSTGATTTSWIFNASSSNSGYTQGNATFNNTSSNTGTISGNAIFDNSSSNSGTVNGSATVFYPVTTPLGGTATGGKVYHSYPNTESFNNAAGDNSWSNPLNWFTDTTFITPLGKVPSTSDDVVLFSSTTLPTDITGNVYIASNDITLDGGGVNGSNMHTISGNVSGDGGYGGQNALSFNLANIIVTGTTTANGSNGVAGANGGNGGAISIATSSTWVVSANGGDPQQNGGDAGNITVVNSYALADNTPILANGGNSTGCGYGGSGGSVVLTNSSGYILLNSAGSDSSVGCPTGPTNGHSGYVGLQQIVGVYTPPAKTTSPPNTTIVSNTSSHGSSGSPLFKQYIFGTTPLIIPVDSVKALSLKFPPTFGGTTKNSFSFLNSIGDFISAPLSDVSKDLKADKQLVKYFASLGLATQQELLNTRTEPISLPIPAKNADIPDGLLMLSSNDTNIPLTASYDSTHVLVEKASVTPGSQLTISLFPTTKGTVTASFNGDTYTFKKAGKTSLLSVNLTAPTATSTYSFNTAGSPMPLVISVETSKPVASAPESLFEKLKNEKIWSVIKSWKFW